MNCAMRMICLLFCLTLLTACAQSGQVLAVSPQGSVPESLVGADIEVAVRAVDQRPDKALGRLENSRGEDAPLTTGQDLEQVMNNALIEALSRKGFRPVAWDPDAPRAMTLQIRSVEHVVSSKVPRQISTRVELGFTATNKNQELTGSARHNHGESVAFRPSAEENADWVNASLDAALERMLVERLLNFLGEE